MHDQLLGSVHGYGVAADKANREVGAGGLLPQDWAGKHRVEPILHPKVNTYLGRERRVV